MFLWQKLLLLFENVLFSFLKLGFSCDTNYCDRKVFIAFK